MENLAISCIINNNVLLSKHIIVGPIPYNYYERLLPCGLFISPITPGSNEFLIGLLQQQLFVFYLFIRNKYFVILPPVRHKNIAFYSTMDKASELEAGLLKDDMFSPGVSIMPVRGIMVEYLFASKDLEVNTPTQIKGRCHSMQIRWCVTGGLLREKSRR